MARMSDRDYAKLLRQVNRRLQHAEEVLGADVVGEFRNILEPILKKQQEQDTRFNNIWAKLLELEVRSR